MSQALGRLPFTSANRGKKPNQPTVASTAGGTSVASSPAGTSGLSKLSGFLMSPSATYAHAGTGTATSDISSQYQQQQNAHVQSSHEVLHKLTMNEEVEHAMTIDSGKHAMTINLMHDLRLILRTMRYPLIYSHNVDAVNSVATLDPSILFRYPPTADPPPPEICDFCLPDGARIKLIPRRSVKSNPRS